MMATLTDTLALYRSSTKSFEVMIRWADKAAVKLRVTSSAVEILNKNLQSIDASRLSTINSRAKALHTYFQRMGTSIKSAAGGLTRFMGSGTKLASMKSGNFLKSSTVQSKADTMSGSKKTLSLGGYADKIKKGMKIADDYANIQKRLNAVNDGSQTQGQLQKIIFGAANQSRGSYAETANTFANLQASGSNVFSSNAETLGFTELMQKSFKLGGTDTATQSAGIDQVVQAMGSGKLQSGDLDAIASNAPMMLEAMETFTGKSKAELRSMAEEGNLTAGVLKNSLFAASGHIGEKFSELPMTFAEVWDLIKNTAMEAFGDVLESINKIMNSSGFQTALAVVIAGIMAVGSVISWLIDKTTEYWDFIAPILEFIGGVALAAIITQLGVMAAAAWLSVVPWLLQHAALLMVVAGIILIINVLGMLGISVQDVFSFVGGAIGVLLAWIHNIPLAISNIATWVSKTIDDFVTKIVNKVIDGINKVITAIRNITGIDIKLLDKYEGSTSGMEYKELEDYSKAYKAGSQKGVDIYNGIGEKANSLKDGGLNFLSGGYSGLNDLGTQGNPVTVQGVGSDGNLAVDMAEEDIQYLRDIAERDYINKFSTATLAPNIQVSFGPVHQEADADKVASRIQTILQEQIAVASEGVY